MKASHESYSKQLKETVGVCFIISFWSAYLSNRKVEPSGSNDQKITPQEQMNVKSVYFDF